jgi:hypothetical protein
MPCYSLSNADFRKFLIPRPEPEVTASSAAFSNPTPKERDEPPKYARTYTSLYYTEFIVRFSSRIFFFLLSLSFVEILFCFLLVMFLLPNVSTESPSSRSPSRKTKKRRSTLTARRKGARVQRNRTTRTPLRSS